MKKRIGFVSNSSSTSFLVIIPDDFDFGDWHQEYLKTADIDDPISMKEFKELNQVDEGMDGGELWRFFQNVKSKFMKKYTFSSWDVQSDCGEIEIKRVSQVNKFLLDIHNDKEK